VDDALLRGDIDHRQVLGQEHRTIIGLAHILKEWIDGLPVLEIAVGYAQFWSGNIKKRAQAVRRGMRAGDELMRCWV
jgi:hypothetical protein